MLPTSSSSASPTSSTTSFGLTALAVRLAARDEGVATRRRTLGLGFGFGLGLGFALADQVGEQFDCLAVLSKKRGSVLATF